jgi:signal peptidase I
MIRWLVAGALLLTFMGWFVALRPQALGGPAAYVLVSGTSMEPTIHAQSLVMAFRRDGYRVGDVVAYRIPAGESASGLLVIHRIIGGSAGTGYVMRGDNAPASDIWRPRPDDILGAEQFVLPAAAPAMTVLRSPILVASIAAGLASFFVLGMWPVKPEERDVAPAPESWRAPPSPAGGHG